MPYTNGLHHFYIIATKNLFSNLCVIWLAHNICDQFILHFSTELHLPSAGLLKNDQSVQPLALLYLVLPSLWKPDNANILFWMPLTKSLCGSQGICQVWGVLPVFFTMGDTQLCVKLNQIIWCLSQCVYWHYKGWDGACWIWGKFLHLNLSAAVRPMQKVEKLKQRK